MTREEAILLSAYTGFLLAPDFLEVHKFCEDTLGRPIWTHEFADRDVQNEIREKLRPKIMELVQNISTLRPVSRERVEQIKGVWIFNDDWWEFRCSECHKGIGNIEKFKFCPHCGAPMTDEAVEMVMERMDKCINLT